MTVAKAIDQASPKLLQALVTNETLTTVKIEFWRPAPETASPYFVIALTNALIVDGALTSSADEDPPAFEQLEYEEFEMTYQKIEVTWVQGGVMASDNWSAPV